MEDEVLESAISQMTIDAETAGLGHPDGIIIQTAIVGGSTYAPEENLMYSPASELNSAIALLQSGGWEIIHEEQHVSGAYLVTIGAVSMETPMLPVTLVVTLDGSNLLHDAQNTEDAPVEIDEQGEALLEAALAAEEVVIPPNSGSLLVDEATSRFSGAIWYSAIQSKTITLAGVGGIGSYVGFLLARLKPAGLYLYDPDIVEQANMSGQLYGSGDLGQAKVSSLHRMLQVYANYYNSVAYQERFTAESEATDIMICGFDNMEARKLFFDAWENRLMAKPEEERGEMLFIDGRLAAEEFQVFAIQGNDTRAMREYRSKWLFSDAVADETICSYKQTTFMANMIASVMVNLFVNFVANECNPIIDRDVPFMTQYSADTMYFKVEM
ncbi:thiamine biosynthesis protein [Bacteroides phage PhiCrAssBcn17]|nr:thiamine biosynthesis protein [Bacteroides phage PhiCrAssBcn17]